MSIVLMNNSKWSVAQQSKKLVKLTVISMSLTVLNACVTTTGVRTQQQDSYSDVLVVGGGLSGLTAAYELERKGYKVTVLEAQNRLGGRVQTSYFENGQYAEAGGELLDADTIHPKIHHYVKNFALDLTDVGYDDEEIEDIAYYHDGKLFAASELAEQTSQQTADDEERFWDALAALAEEIPDATKPYLAPDALYLDAISALDWVKSLNLTPTAEAIALHALRGEYGEPKDLSLLFLAQQQKAYEDVDDDDIEINRIKGGNTQLIKAFADNMKGPIFLNSPVVSLIQTQTGVTATTKDGAHYNANYAVVSVPASVLKNISFSPELPEKMLQATQLHYGQHNKVMLQYKERFWLKRGFGGDTISELPIGWTWEETDQQEGEAGILVAYTSGALTEDDAMLSVEALVDKRRHEIATMYPESEGLFIDAKVETWQSSPWVEGGYVAYAPNQVVPFWTAFHEPFGKVYFIGEHTDDSLPGYMEGAVRSGQRVVEQIALKKEKNK